jgi:hypothetical protein
MSDQPEPEYPSEQALAQAALERVRAVFKGNGVKLDSIKIASQKISRHTMNAGTYLELKPVLSERHGTGKAVSGVLVASREEAMRQVDQAMLGAARDAGIKSQIAGVLLARPDQGFGLSRQAIPLEFLKKEFTWHESCHTCRGAGKAPCQKCQGRRVEPCIKCSGRGLMPCPLCRSTGLLQGNKCTRCNGQRYVPCDQCQRSGMMPCRMCSATGIMKCPTCAGLGWKSHTIMLVAQALTYFEYDAKSVPKGAADMVETQASKLAAEHRVKITGRVADDKENVLGANYEVNFPFGEIVFTLGKKEVKANLFGFKGNLTDFPNVLDKIVGPAIQELEEAAQDIGSVADKIQKATRYRVIAQGFLTASRLSTKKTVDHLMKHYDIGLSLSMAEKIAVLADETTSRITRKPRYYGLFGGLAIVALIDAAYYLLPLRSAIASYLPTMKFDFVLDILPPLVGGLITTMTIQFAGARAIRKALGHLTPKGQKSTLVPKSRSHGTWGYVCSALIALGMMEAAAHMSASAPYWYEIVRNFILRMAGS